MLSPWLQAEKLPKNVNFNTASKIQALEKLDTNYVIDFKEPAICVYLEGTSLFLQMNWRSSMNIHRYSGGGGD